MGLNLEKRVLGRTRIEVSALGFGGIPIQRVSSEEAVETVRKCYELGIDFYDTARVYTNSEERIGKALEEVRDQVVLATKTVRRTREGLLNELEVSLRNLRTDWLDIYQLHMVSAQEEWETIKGPGGALEGMYEAREDGRIRHLGITCHKPDLLAEIIAEGVFDTAMIPYNYLSETPNQTLLPLAKKIGVGTIAMKPFGGGAISHVRTALKYALSNGDIDVVIPGMMMPSEVESNVEVASGDLTLTPEDQELIDEDRRSLGAQFCRACDYCRPCPQGIPISFVLRAEDQFLKLTGWTLRLISQIPEAKAKVDTCTRCGQCEGRCPYELPIRDLLPKKMGSLLSLYEKHTATRC